MTGRARVAWNLRRLRTDRGISQEGLAFQAKVDRTTVSLIERGKVAVSVDMLDRFAKALDVDLATFLEPIDAAAEPPGRLPSGPRTRA